MWLYKRLKIAISIESNALHFRCFWMKSHVMKEVKARYSGVNLKELTRQIYYTEG